MAQFEQEATLASILSRERLAYAQGKEDSRGIIKDRPEAFTKLTDRISDGPRGDAQFARHGTPSPLMHDLDNPG